MVDITTFNSRPESCIEVLKTIFSNTAFDSVAISKKIGKKKGYVSNSIHDLVLLGLLEKADDGKYVISEDSFPTTKSIVYGRNTNNELKKLFVKVSGHTGAINELNGLDALDRVNIGKTFAFHTNARATKESSWKEIGSRYVGWLAYLRLIEEGEDKTLILISKKD
jgi:hypothetical protein